MAHEHDFEYQGVQYAHGHGNRPGSGAVSRYYAHVYFCRRCLEKRYERIKVDDCSYYDVKFGASMGSTAHIVPSYDLNPVDRARLARPDSSAP